MTTRWSETPDDILFKDPEADWLELSTTPYSQTGDTLFIRIRSWDDSPSVALTKDDAKVLIKCLTNWVEKGRLEMGKADE